MKILKKSLLLSTSLLCIAHGTQAIENSSIGNEEEQSRQIPKKTPLKSQKENKQAKEDTQVSKKKKVSQVYQIKRLEDLYYRDDDISEYIESILKQNNNFTYFGNSKYVLTSEKDEFSPIEDKKDGYDYIVAVTPAIDTWGINQARDLLSGGSASSTNIGYFLDKSSHPKEEQEIILEKLMSFSSYDELLREIKKIKRNGLKLELVNEILLEQGEKIENIQNKFKEEHNKIKKKKKDVFDELMPFFLKPEYSYAKILFPYNRSQSHWLTGEIWLYRKKNQYRVKVYTHDPYGQGKMEDPSYYSLKKVIKKRIREFNSAAQFMYFENTQSPYKNPRQNRKDGISCGIVAAEDLIKRIVESLEGPCNPIGALDLRRLHLQTVAKNNPGLEFISRNKVKIDFINQYQTLLDDLPLLFLSLQDANKEERKAQKSSISIEKEDAVRVFTMLTTLQVGELQEEENKVSEKIRHLKESEDSLKHEIEELRNKKKVHHSEADSKKREKDLKKLEKEQESLEEYLQELKEGRHTIEEVATDTQSVAKWEEHITIPIVGSGEELKNSLANHAELAADNIYRKNEKLNPKIPPKGVVQLEEESQSFFNKEEDEPEMNAFLAKISEKSIEKEDEGKLLKVSEYLQKKLEEIRNLFDKHGAKPITVVVGKTGAGKSTLCCWLIGQGMKSIEIKNRSGRFGFEDTGEIGGGSTSKTKQPQIYPGEDYEGELYGDCPGFNDTRGILQQIKNFFYIQHLFKNRNIKFLLAAPKFAFETGEIRGESVVDALANLKSMLKNPELLNNSVSLVVTQSKKKDSRQKWIEEEMREYAKEKAQQDKQLSDLMLSIANSNKIAFFSRPPEDLDNYQTHPQSESEKKELLRILKDTKYLSLKEDDLTFSPSFPTARLLLIQMLDNLKEHMNKLLDPYAQSIKDHFDTKRENFSKMVDSFVNQGIEYYTPIVLFKGLPKELEELCGSEIMEKAVARNKKLGRIALGVGGALFVVTTVTIALPVALIAAPITVPVVGLIAGSVTTVSIPIVVGGVAGGLAGGGVVGGVATAGAAGGSFLFRKGLWEGFLRNEFIEREGKKLKTELYNCILDLQDLKNSILNDSHFNPRLTFDPPPNISEIKNTTHLLHFIRYLQGKPILSQDIEVEKIWNNAFKRITETMVKQFCETSQDFYYEEKGPSDRMEVSWEKILPILTSPPLGDLTKEIKEKKLSHIPMEFVDLVLRSYSKESDTHQKSIYPPFGEKKLKKLIHYMNLCKGIYTDHHTRKFVPNNPQYSIVKIWEKVIKNKKEADKLHQNLLAVRAQNDAIDHQPTIYEAQGSREVPSYQVVSIPRSGQTPNIQENYTKCIDEINVFLEMIGEDAFRYNDLKYIGSTIGALENIQNKIYQEFLWYFNEKHVDESKMPVYIRVSNENYPLSHQSVIAASFLNKALLSQKQNIFVLDVGFRHLNKLEGICNVIKEKLLSFKKNPLAWFNGLGEVDYIAYIEKDPRQVPIKDKLVIVYSGSNSIRDWKTNITIGRTAFVDLAVHEGMGHLMGESANTYFGNLIDKVGHYYTTHQKPQNFKIVTTGHSLGGALALLGAYYYKRVHTKNLSDILGINEDKISVKTFTFAAPAIIDEVSKQKIEENFGKENILITWNYHDPVPFLTQKLASEVGRSFPLFDISKHNFGRLDKTVAGCWGHHAAERYLHHLMSLENSDKTVKDFITILESYANNIRNFYRVGRDVGIFKPM